MQICLWIHWSIFYGSGERNNKSKRCERLQSCERTIVYNLWNHFVILGIPLLEGQNTPYVLLSVIGVMVETIVIMAAYSLVIVKSMKRSK